MRNTLRASSLLVALPLFLFVVATTASAAWRCCDSSAGQCGNALETGCDACTDTVTKNAGVCGPTCTQAEINAGTCRICGAGKVSNVCGGGSTSKPATCTQSVYALENPTNMQIGQTKDFYADGLATNGNFSRMTATMVNVPAGTPAVATVASTGPHTCYANGNCRQGFRITARANGTALVTVRTLVRLCPACAETGSCSKTYTVNVGNVTPLACVPGAGCTSSTGAIKVGSDITCKMPVLSSAQLGGGTAAYYSECTPFKGTTAQTKIAKSSATGTFASFKVATGVTNIKCSFRHCVTGSDNVVKCTNWGTAS